MPEAAKPFNQNGPRRRPNASARGYDRRWRKAREAYLTEHPLCVECQKKGLTVVATVVDHVIPHRGNEELFWSETNWAAVCKACHDRKTGSGQ